MSSDFKTVKDLGTGEEFDSSLYQPFLYFPATRPDLDRLLSGYRDLGACNLAVCLEDALHAWERPQAAAVLCQILANAADLPLRVFIRPADFPSLDWLLEQPGIERVSGFLLPKATVSRIQQWVERVGQRHWVLPIMESREALDPFARRDLSQVCAAHRQTIPAARIGANDLLALLGGLRRPPARTIYETPVGHVINGLIEAFSACDVRLCAPVFDRIGDLATLAREVEEDVHHGLFAKAAVHPSQVFTIVEASRPSHKELEEAQRILHPEAPAVFALHGGMAEPACHSGWARQLLRRAEAFGLRKETP